MRRKIIVFVCRGNIARSPIAEFLLNKKLKKEGLNNRYITISRGVQGTLVDPKPVKYPNITYYEDLWRDTEPALKAHGIDIVSSHISKVIDKNMINNAAIIFAMDKKTQKALTTLFPNEKEKIYMFSELIGDSKDILDPEGIIGSEKQFEVINSIDKTIEQGFMRLLNLLKDK